MNNFSGLWAVADAERVTYAPVVMRVAAWDLERQHLLELTGVGEMLSELIISGKSCVIFRSWLGLGRAVSPRTVRVKCQNGKTCLV